MTLDWLPRGRRRYALIALDLVAVTAANALANLLRFDFDWGALRASRHKSAELLLLDLLLTPVIFFSAGLYEGYLRYAGLDDLLRLSRAVAFRTIALFCAFYALGFVDLSRAIVLMAAVFVLMFSGGVRLAPRFHRELFVMRRRSTAPRALVIGAGDTGEALLREIRKRPDPEINPVGFLDDDPDKRGVKIHGIPVLGRSVDLAAVIESSGARDVIVAVPTLAAPAIREIFEVCRRAGVRLRTVPTRGEIERGEARLGQIRAVDVEDLLGREVVRLDQGQVRDGLRGRTVLITGAAGSIGRELVRQALSFEPQEVVLLDRNENNLFYLEHELRDRHVGTRLVIRVADVADRQALETIFRQHRPAVVLHAAAYKHVPLMEHNPLEAIKNNVIATQGLAEVSAAFGVERFIYISTDKAVRPTSVMGATKRLGERLVKSLPRGRTRFMAVRFGNVLGSDGSVVPTFRKQIAAGGPVTVTHPEATRYFMTIQEAVQLVLTAGVMGEGGETFLLRMGDPVRIEDLARNLIALSGLQPDEDIRIVHTGLRPGEKLHEELQTSNESTLPTSSQKIMILTGIEPLDETDWRHLSGLRGAVCEEVPDQALRLLRLLVPDYTPMGAAAALESTVQNIVDISVKKR
jgi:FlaA1/EpsC-like NDP-sugar epimerase